MGVWIRVSSVRKPVHNRTQLHTIRQFGLSHSEPSDLIVILGKINSLNDYSPQRENIINLIDTHLMIYVRLARGVWIRSTAPTYRFVSIFQLNRNVLEFTDRHALSIGLHIIRPRNPRPTIADKFAVISHFVTNLQLRLHRICLLDNACCSPAVQSQT